MRSAVSSKFNDSSENLAEALERAADQYGGQLDKFKYCSCRCGMLVRLLQLPDSAEFRVHKITAWAGACPDCKRQMQLTVIPPASAVQIAKPGDVPPAH